MGGTVIRHVTQHTAAKQYTHTHILHTHTPSRITRDALLKKRGEAMSETYLQVIAKGA